MSFTVAIGRGLYHVPNDCDIIRHDQRSQDLHVVPGGVPSYHRTFRTPEVGGYGPYSILPYMQTSQKQGLAEAELREIGHEQPEVASGASRTSQNCQEAPLRKAPRKDNNAGQELQARQPRRLPTRPRESKSQGRRTAGAKGWCARKSHRAGYQTEVARAGRSVLLVRRAYRRTLSTGPYNPSVAGRLQ